MNIRVLFSSLALVMAGLLAGQVQAQLTVGQTIKLDFSDAGDADGGSVADWNTVINGDGFINPLLHGGGTATGVNIAVSNFVAGNFNNDAASGDWAGTAADPFYILAADDIYFHGDAVNPLIVSYSGLDDSLTYDVRVYSLIGNNAGVDKTFTLTDGAGTQSVTVTNDQGWSAATLELGGTVFSGLQTNGAGGIDFTATDETFYAMNALTITATSVPEPTSAALLGLCGLGLMLRRRRS